MRRIKIFANGSGSVSQLQSGLSTLHSSITSTIEDLRTVTRKMSNLSGGLGNLSGAYQSVNTRISAEENRLISVECVSRASATFLSNTVFTDSRVARLVNQSQERFFETHPWLRPVVAEEKSWWEQRVEDWNNIWSAAGEVLRSTLDGIVSWVKEHAVEIVIGAVAIVVGAAIVALTGGAAAAFIPALLAGLKATAISAVISGAISAALAALTGNDVLNAFGDGLASGFMWGGIISFASSAISGVFKSYVNNNPGIPTGRQGGKAIGNGFKVLSPDGIATDGNSGGVLFKITSGKLSDFHVDVDTRVLGLTKLKDLIIKPDLIPNYLHMHIPNFTATIKPLFIHNGHIPIGLYISSIIGGMTNQRGKR